MSMPYDHAAKQTMNSILQTAVVVPYNQRTYKWKQSHVELFIKDLWSAVKKGQAYSVLGEFVFLSKGDKNYVFDGQQLLITTIVTAAAMCKVHGEAVGFLKHKIVSDSYKDPTPDQQEKMDSLGVKNFSPVHCMYDVDERDLMAIVNFVEQPKNPGAVMVAYMTAVKYIEEQQWSPEAARSFAKHLLDKTLVDIRTCKDMATAVDMFKLFNNRGVSLNPIDLARNDIVFRVSGYAVAAELSHMFCELDPAKGGDMLQLAINQLTGVLPSVGVSVTLADGIEGLLAGSPDVDAAALQLLRTASEINQEYRDIENDSGLDGNSVVKTLQWPAMKHVILITRFLGHASRAPVMRLICGALLRSGGKGMFQTSPRDLTMKAIVSDLWSGKLSREDTLDRLHKTLLGQTPENFKSDMELKSSAALQILRQLEKSKQGGKLGIEQLKSTRLERLTEDKSSITLQNITLMDNSAHRKAAFEKRAVLYARSQCKLANDVVHDDWLSTQSRAKRWCKEIKKLSDEKLFTDCK